MALLNSTALKTHRAPRQKLSEKSVQVFLKLVPSVSEGTQATHRFFATFLSVVTGIGLLILLAVNILLAQDAFQLSALKAEAKVVADQREAINRQIEAASSPEALAAKARSLGMRPSNSPVFLNLDAVDQALANGEIKRG
jgi:cell division protein FtsB